ncbi:hypothetical protein TREMEDRAFT_58711 [Tremella mesenterica DSM 1558]|uniref:uncharacterized protein n=1 Tax=Tremella mesenterica (strain ATCC 24925 / CBS 8224 / DSM 1558 / NBRC 9311 / NRRL Y-6157 / RJB 2259-6 / UBC 559-6) TaxID=578456 RepID=UPI0003F495DE|nr:uncharacterized protein TREMEDRAFT_58711 [Tremella mesenterica DSM 1558]EIW72539.1 hypothetical protein TREMEDRAFT_58711 [Tremella mesenterica DSM 1558]
MRAFYLESYRQNFYSDFEYGEQPDDETEIEEEEEEVAEEQLLTEWLDYRLNDRRVQHQDNFVGPTEDQMSKLLYSKIKTDDGKGGLVDTVDEPCYCSVETCIYKTIQKDEVSLYHETAVYHLLWHPKKNTSDLEVLTCEAMTNMTADKRKTFSRVIFNIPDHEGQVSEEGGYGLINASFCLDNQYPDQDEVQNCIDVYDEREDPSTYEWKPMEERVDNVVKTSKKSRNRTFKTSDNQLGTIQRRNQQLRCGNSSCKFGYIASGETSLYCKTRGKKSLLLTFESSLRVPLQIICVLTFHLRYDTQHDSVSAPQRSRHYIVVTRNRMVKIKLLAALPP